MKHRRGSSLLEVMVYISLIGVVLGLTATFLVMLLRADKSARDHLAETSGVRAFTERFRSDVRKAHRATTANEDPSQQELMRLYGPDDQLIEYLAGRGEMFRRVRSGGTTIHNDRFRIPDDLAATAVLETDGEHLFARIDFRATIDTVAARRREFSILALVGGDLRHSLVAASAAGGVQ